MNTNTLIIGAGVVLLLIVLAVIALNNLFSIMRMRKIKRMLYTPTNIVHIRLGDYFVNTANIQVLNLQRNLQIENMKVFLHGYHISEASKGLKVYYISRKQGLVGVADTQDMVNVIPVVNFLYAKELSEMKIFVFRVNKNDLHTILKQESVR